MRVLVWSLVQVVLIKLENCRSKNPLPGNLKRWCFWSGCLGGSAEWKSVKKDGHPVLQGALADLEEILGIWTKSNAHNMSAVSVTFSTPVSIISL